MWFAALKDVDVQAMLSLHRTRHLLFKQRTQMINSLRGESGEFGVVAPQNRAVSSRFLADDSAVLIEFGPIRPNIASYTAI